MESITLAICRCALIASPIPFDVYTQTAFKAGWNAAMREVIKIATPSPSVEE
jgi:hypothetical protein